MAIRTTYQRTLFLALLYLFCLAAPAAHAAAAEGFPKPQGAVNDFAGVISADYRNRIESLSREVLQKTGTSIVVATMATIEGNDLNDYVNRLYQAWGIGRKGQDKGILIFLALKERKIRIETGYGVEGILPDGLVGEIRDKHMVPSLGRGEYGMGLYNGVYAIAAIVTKDAGVDLARSGQPGKPAQQKASRGLSPLALILIVLVLIVLLFTPAGREVLPWVLLFIFSGRGGGGGGGDGGGGGFGGFGGFGGGLSGGGGASGDF